MFDTIIRNGEVIDGTRKSRYRADIGVRGDRIATIGDLRQAQAHQTIDAANQVVTPGFIDVHNHSDGWLLKTSHLTPKTLQGFTAEILMADGISYAPVNNSTAPHWLFYLRALNGLRMDEYRGWRSLSEYMQQIDGRNVQNAAMHVPFANVRALACGFGPRIADDVQIQQMQSEIRDGMEQGAVGLSTGLDYIVQCYATTEELIQVCSVMSDYGGVYVTHVRYKKGLMAALEEAVQIGRRASVPVHISHLKHQHPGTEQILEFVDRARRDVDLTFDIYPYQPGSTMLNYLLPYETWEDGPLSAMARLHETAIRERFRVGLEADRFNFDRIRIAWVPGKENTCVQGKTLAQYVDESGQPAEDAILNLLLEERLAVLCVFEEGEDRLVHPFLQHEAYMMGTDGIYFPDGLVHPRMFGSTGRLLGPCVRDWKLFSLEDAVYKLSGFPAERFGLRNRGVLLEGNFADIVVLDPERVCDQATLEQPSRPTVGIQQVLVNGVPIIRSGEPLQDFGPRLPGRFLRSRV